MTCEQLHELVCGAVPSDCDVQVDWSTRRHAGRHGYRTTRSVEVTVVSRDLLRVCASGETCSEAWVSFQRAWETVMLCATGRPPSQEVCR